MNARQCGHIRRLSTTGYCTIAPVRTLVFLLFFSAMLYGQQQRQPETYRLPPDKYAKAVEFHRRLNVLHFAGVAWDLTVLLAMIRMRTGPRIRDGVERRLRRPLAARAAIVGALLAIPWIAGIPLAAYAHCLGLHYGISVEAWLPWFGDLAKGGAISAVVTVLIVLAVLALARRSRRWWIWSWALSVAVMIAGTYLAPLVVDPLFFRFRPLDKTNPALVRALQQVASRAGYQIPEDRIFDMDASTKTRAVNAYMTGFGHSRRIVIWDTTLAVLDIPQIQTVFAHELGHYALNHIPLSIGIAAIGLFGVFWLADAILRWLIRRRGDWLGVRAISDPAILPLAMAFVVVIGFVSEPVANGYSRWQEHQADIYELEAMHGLVPDAGPNSARVDQIMAEIDLDDPNPSPFIRFWLYDHPPTAQRMQFAQQYDPWARGERPKYIR